MLRRRCREREDLKAGGDNAVLQVVSGQRSAFSYRQAQCRRAVPSLQLGLRGNQNTTHGPSISCYQLAIVLSATIKQGTILPLRCHLACAELPCTSFSDELAIASMQARLAIQSVFNTKRNLGNDRCNTTFEQALRLSDILATIINGVGQAMALPARNRCSLSSALFLAKGVTALTKSPSLLRPSTTVYDSTLEDPNISGTTCLHGV
jgi:hypothetical protein